MADDGKVRIGTELDSSGAEKGIGKLKGSLGKISKVGSLAFKGTAVAVGAAATAIGGLTAKSLGAYAQFEQLAGGVETLFGAKGAKSLEEYAEMVGKSTKDVKGEYEDLTNSQAMMMKNADEAYKNAGMSANQYMETATSFAAALRSSTESSTEAAQQANLAITDMSDNANKMGTSMESIQNAYQGFAKQNYTMLDNLKLGYGGTKSEMERLIADANKLREAQGLNADLTINSYSDVVTAIHEVQTQIGITGTTQKEAATTIEGSLNMTKSAWENLIAGMSRDDVDFGSLVDNFVNSLDTLSDNVMPRLEQIFDGIGEVINKLVPKILSNLGPKIMEVAPKLISSAIQLLQQIGNALVNNAPNIIKTVQEVLSTVFDVVQNTLSNIPNILAENIDNISSFILPLFDNIINTIISLLDNVVSSISSKMPDIISKILDSLDSIVDNLANNASKFVEAGINLLKNLAQGFADSFPVLIEKVPDLITKVANIINDNAPKILMGGVSIVLTLVKGLIKAIPTLVKNIPKIIKAILSVWEAVNWWNLGKTLITGLVKGITGLLGSVKKAGSSIAENITKVLRSLPSKLKDIGSKGLKGLIAGIKGLLTKLGSVAKNIVTAVINGIKSLPAKAKNIGLELVKGLWKGITGMTGWVLNKVSGFGKSVVKGFKKVFDIHSPSRVMRDEIGKNIVLGLVEGLKKEKGTAVKTAKEISNEIYEKSKTKYEHYKIFHKTTIDDDISFWKQLVKQTKKYSKEWWESQKQYHDLVNQKREEEKQTQKDLLQQYKDTVAEYKQQSEEIIQTYKATIDNLVSTYQSEYADKIKSIKSAMGNIFDAFSISETDDTKETLAQNLQDQINGMKDYQNSFEELASKGLPLDMLDEIKELGIGATAQIKLLNSMTSEELANYIDLWNDKNALAREIADKEMQGAKENLVKQMEQAQVEMNKELDNLSISTQRKLEKISSQMNKSGKNIGKNLIAGVRKGMENKRSEFQRYINNYFADMVATAQAALDIHSPSRKFKWIGEMCVEGLKQPFKKWNPSESIQDALAKTQNDLRLQIGNGTGNINNSRTITQVININKEVSTPDDIARTLRLEARYGLIGG